MRCLRVSRVGLLVSKEGCVMWHYKAPILEDFDSQEEYEDALATYESAYDDYCDMVEEAWREERES